MYYKNNNEHVKYISVKPIINYSRHGTHNLNVGGIGIKENEVMWEGESQSIILNRFRRKRKSRVLDSYHEMFISLYF